MLEDEAQKSGRSLNSEIVHRLLPGGPPPTQDQVKRQIVLDSLLEAVEEVCKWSEHVEHDADDANARHWLKESLDDLSMWNTRLKRLDSAK